MSIILYIFCLFSTYICGYCKCLSKESFVCSKQEKIYEVWREQDATDMFIKNGRGSSKTNICKKLKKIPETLRADLVYLAAMNNRFSKRNDYQIIRYKKIECKQIVLRINNKSELLAIFPYKNKSGQVSEIYCMETPRENYFYILAPDTDAVNKAAFKVVVELKPSKQEYLDSLWEEKNPNVI